MAVAAHLVGLVVELEVGEGELAMLGLRMLPCRRSTTRTRAISSSTLKGLVT